MDDINAVVDDEENYDFSSQKDSFDYNYDENASAEEETTTYNPLDDEEGQTEESEFTYPQIEYEEVSEIPAPKINLDYKEPTVSYQEPEAFNSEDNTPSESLNLDQNSNVTILMRLISGLPAGVTRQTSSARL
ncbi:MAG: hypothetical protein MZV64_27435 [Ignavibacteriales bacterium]|nr:hypothetical protein [Ignavibacteriales bacterium]